MEHFIREFMFSNEYWKWSLIAFFVLSFIVGLFKQVIEEKTGGMPFGIQVFCAALLACLWPLASIVLLCLLPSLLGWWLGERVRNFREIKKGNFSKLGNNIAVGIKCRWNTRKMSESERFAHMFDKSIGLVKKWSEIRVGLVAA